MTKSIITKHVFKKCGILIILACILACIFSCQNIKIDEKNVVRFPSEIRPVDILYASNKYQNKTEITFAEMQEDLETFIYLVETAYIGYDDAVEHGLDTNVQRQFVLGQFDNQEKIQIQDFADVLYDAFAGYIQDNHASINYYNNNFWKSFIKKGYLYFSDVYVQKIGVKYVVCESNQLEIKPGAVYNSDVEYLLLYPAKGKDVYRLCF